MVFDEVSSWWSSQAMALLDSKEIEEKLEQWLVEHYKANEKESSDKGAQ